MSVSKMVLVVSMLCVFVTAASAQTLRVNADRTTLRDKPSTDGAAVAGLVKGDELTSIEKAGSWYRVRVKSSGVEGFVNALLVDIVGAAAPAAPSPTAPASLPPPAAPVSRPLPTTPPAQAAAPTPAATDRNYFIRVHAGLLTGYGNAGLGFGGGVGMRPFDNEKMEIAVDGLYGRTSQAYLNDSFSTSVLAVSGNFLYNFQTASQKFTPYAGAGLVMSRASVSEAVFGVSYSVSGTYTSLQVLGGIEKPLNDKRAFRAEIRSGFASFGGSLLLLAGLSF